MFGHMFTMSWSEFSIFSFFFQNSFAKSALKNWLLSATVRWAPIWITFVDSLFITKLARLLYIHVKKAAFDFPICQHSSLGLFPLPLTPYFKDIPYSNQWMCICMCESERGRERECVYAGYIVYLNYHVNFLPLIQT